MKYHDKYLTNSLNKILNLQIDAIHELFNTNSNDRHNLHASILKRKQMVDQLITLILSLRGSIDKRNFIRSSHHFTGENGVNSTKDQLIELYQDFIEDDQISMGMKATLRKHYEIISSDLAVMVIQPSEN